MIGKKADVSKKDMNFFSEFSTSGAQVASMLTLVLILIVVMFVLATGFLLFVVFQTNGVQNDINKIREELNDPDNQLILEEFDRLSMTLENRREYLFVLTDLKNKLESNRFVDTTNMDAVTENIPDDVVLTHLHYIDGTIQFGGMCESYDSALNYVAQLQSEDLFDYIHIDEITYHDPTQLADYFSIDMSEEDLESVWKYSYSFTGALESSYLVTMTRYYDGVPQTFLSIPMVREYVTGESFSFDDIATFTAEGVEYRLNRIVINGDVVPEDEFAIMLQEDAVYGITLGLTDIRLMYLEVDNTPSEGGDA